MKKITLNIIIVTRVHDMLEDITVSYLYTLQATVIGEPYDSTRYVLKIQEQINLKFLDIKKSLWFRK